MNSLHLTNLHLPLRAVAVALLQLLAAAAAEVQMGVAEVAAALLRVAEEAQPSLVAAVLLSVQEGGQAEAAPGRRRPHHPSAGL